MHTVNDQDLSAWSLLRCAWQESAVDELWLKRANRTSKVSRQPGSFSMKHACKEIHNVGGASSINVLIPTPKHEISNLQQASTSNQTRLDVALSMYRNTLLNVSADNNEPSEMVAKNTLIESWSISGGTSGIAFVASASIRCTPSVSAVKLLGRSGRTSASLSSSVTLKLDNVCMSVHRIDVASVEDTHQPHIFQEGFIHASGLLADAGLAWITAGSARTIFAPKTLSVTGMNQSVEGAFNLRAVVTFSSLATIGSCGQGMYAAANKLLDVGVSSAR